jgi:rhodanese-related sulfurtransferase/glyoxylase-like metal-dependent hydrolase (beta-lactamase superfamily II)
MWISLIGLSWIAPSGAPGAEDAEAATHDAAAATPQVSFEERVGDFFLRQYQLGCLSQLTYLLGSEGVGAVIDPQRDIDHYLKDAREEGLNIKYVILTHTNADFVAGHTELRAKTGAEILISAESQSKFPHRPLKDNDSVELGNARLVFWATPGHTLDSMTILAHVPGAPADPAYAFTGDTLFIGGIGRPDLVGGDITPALLAGKAFDSIQRLRKLPDGTKVLPGHGAGSLCGAHLSPETVSTMGEEKNSNPFLGDRSRSSFVAEMISDLPLAPAYFAYNVSLNRNGPPLVKWTETLPPALAPQKVKDLASEGGWVVDVRSKAQYAESHVPNSLNIDVRGRLDTWAGAIVPHDASIVLVGNDDEVREAFFRLKRIGYDKISGYLEGNLDAWTKAGFPIQKTRSVTVKELWKTIQSGEEPLIVDVRTPSEYAEARIGNYANIPVSDYERFGQVLDRTKPVLLMCNSAYRSSLAAGLLEKQGFQDIGSLTGGLEAWLDASYPILGSAATEELGAGSAINTSIFLPEPVEPKALATALGTQPEVYAVFDIRPQWQYEEYHVPGARHTGLNELPSLVEKLPDAARIVIVDRDGQAAHAVAGALLIHLGPRGKSVRVLAGGTARYYQEVELGSPVKLGSPPPAVKSVETKVKAPPPAKPSKVRKIRRAGC